MRTTLTLSCLLLLYPALSAQGEAARASDPPDAAAAVAAAAQYAALEQRVADLRATFREEQIAAVKQAREAAAAAKASGKKPSPMRAIRMAPPLGELFPDFRAGAERFAGQQGAVPFLLWIVDHGAVKLDDCRWAAETLLEDHLDSAALAALPAAISRSSRALGRSAVAEMLGQLVERSPYPAVRAQAMLVRSRPVVREAKLGSESYAAARAELVKAAELSDDPALQAKVKGLIAGRETLAKGRIAPDIEGVDLDGVAFKLSDYAGKVVLLDFWGDW